MPECGRCGEHISPTYQRVMGEDGEAHACPSCTDSSANIRGAPARPEWDHAAPTSTEAGK